EGSDKQLSLFKEIVARGLSVQATDALIKQPRSEAKEHGSSGEHERAPEKTAHVASIEDELRQKLATRIEIKVKGKDRGQFVLGFESNDDFERLLEVLRR